MPGTLQVSLSFILTAPLYEVGIVGCASSDANTKVQRAGSPFQSPTNDTCLSRSHPRPKMAWALGQHTPLSPHRPWSLVLGLKRFPIWVIQVLLSL